ncbi:MAG TPA: retropepsin-like aspartic protease [Candidatus Nanoarchaeia archaeon]|nr:retropepsin-like aspartic protease [Candidatus Nanoarchaeia archaeon]
MTLTYKFNKYRLENGQYVSRPRIPIVLKGTGSIDAFALLDTGADTTVIPESIASSIGLDMTGQRDKLYAYRESSEVIPSKVDITFLGKARRQSIQLQSVPVLITIGEQSGEIVLGIQKIFDEFDITFKKKQNKIIFKKIQ